MSHMDISRYGAGIRPMSGNRRSGVRYVFTDSLKTSRQHDTSFWEFAATLNDTGDYQWRSLPDYTTLRELIYLCGDVISSVALFERDISSSDVLSLASRCGDIPEPLMVYQLTRVSTLFVTISIIRLFTVPCTPRTQ